MSLNDQQNIMITSYMSSYFNAYLKEQMELPHGIHFFKTNHTLLHIFVNHSYIQNPLLPSYICIVINSFIIQIKQAYEAPNMKRKSSDVAQRHKPQPSVIQPKASLKGSCLMLTKWRPIQRAQGLPDEMAHPAYQ